MYFLPEKSSNVSIVIKLLAQDLDQALEQDLVLEMNLVVLDLMDLALGPDLMDQDLGQDLVLEKEENQVGLDLMDQALGQDLVLEKEENQVGQDLMDQALGQDLVLEGNQVGQDPMDLVPLVQKCVLIMDQVILDNSVTFQYYLSFNFHLICVSKPDQITLYIRLRITFLILI